MSRELADSQVVLSQNPQSQIAASKETPSQVPPLQVTDLQNLQSPEPQSPHTQTHDQVRQYYAETLSSSKDLKTNACCPIDSIDESLKQLLSEIHPEVIERFYGCGSPIPPLLTGLTVLDLGCGSGRDCFVLSKLVGPNGKVIGVDMTEEQLAIGRRHLDYHAKQFGHQTSNIRFAQGYMEDLSDLGISDNSIDIVVSNCVLNLSPSKQQVFSEIFRVLKPGGELYFSDIFALRRIPHELQADPILRGECLSGALYLEDFRRILSDCGCPDYRVVSDRPLEIGDPEIEEKIGMIPFRSMTIRAFKLPLEDRCEDYGQVAFYKGTLPDHPHSFSLDTQHQFLTGKPSLICGNTAAMLSGTRFGAHFRIEGDTSQHFGLFDCGTGGTSGGADTGSGACC